MASFDPGKMGLDTTAPPMHSFNCAHYVPGTLCFEATAASKTNPGPWMDSASILVGGEMVDKMGLSPPRVGMAIVGWIWSHPFQGLGWTWLDATQVRPGLGPRLEPGHRSGWV